MTIYLYVTGIRVEELRYTRTIEVCKNIRGACILLILVHVHLLEQLKQLCHILLSESLHIRELSNHDNTMSLQRAQAFWRPESELGTKRVPSMNPSLFLAERAMTTALLHPP
ncbi:PREDICTED: uncharacterized protein LOC109218681 [Nicotiana attenuata]|uniref:uncharacterized protein LOC109218681 n=1 Tax=Nicotiana attenuata TaxID=49451 RepID=UPI0009058EAB|nr:PREDICTED: uncharacterized protein LOC109218681 [Nicotiana attenuata]